MYGIYRSRQLERRIAEELARIAVDRSRSGSVRVRIDYRIEHITLSLFRNAIHQGSINYPRDARAVSALPV